MELTKTCTLCKETKTLDRFTYLASKDYYQARCKLCIKNIHTLRRREAGKKINTGEFTRIIDYIATTRKSSKCFRCEESDYCCLDFHHTRDKLFNLSKKSFQGKTLDDVKKEITKCIILCANCHRKLHKGRFSVNFQPVIQQPVACFV